jgi:HlyD family secretion protein
VETAKKEGIITIPLGCINPNGCIFVVGNDGETVYERHISTGLQDINKVEVISGVSPDEEVVVSPYEAINKRLTDNGKIFIDRDQH